MSDAFMSVLREVATLFGNLERIFDVVSKLKDHSDDLVADLIEALSGDEGNVKAAAAFSLGHLFYVFWPDEIDASSSMPELLKLIDHADPRVRFEATRAVAVLQVGRIQRLTDEQIVAAYIGCLEYGDASLKIEVVSQLGGKSLLSSGKALAVVHFRSALG